MAKRARQTMTTEHWTHHSNSDDFNKLWPSTEGPIPNRIWRSQILSTLFILFFLSRSSNANRMLVDSKSKRNSMSWNIWRSNILI